MGDNNERSIIRRHLRQFQDISPKIKHLVCDDTLALSNYLSQKKKKNDICPKNLSTNNFSSTLSSSHSMDRACPESSNPNDADQKSQSMSKGDGQNTNSLQLDDASHESSDFPEFRQLSLSDILLSREDCERLGYLDWPDRQPPDLNPPFIHPILLEHNGFRGSKEEYALIEPAIRIATQLLFLPRTLLFVYSLVYECKELPIQFNFDGYPCRQFRMTEERDPDVYFEKAMHIYNEVARNNRK